MCNAASERTHGFHFLGVTKTCFEFLAGFLSLFALRDIYKGQYGAGDPL